MSKIPSLEEILKLYTKKDLWERIQQHIQTIDQLKQQLAEKDKKIEMLNTIKNNAIECADLFKVALSIRQKDLAIQELSEVERLLYESHYKEIDNRYYAEYEDIKILIDSEIQQLEELKEGKEVED